MAHTRNIHNRTLPVPVTPEEQDAAGRLAATMQVEIATLKDEIEKFSKPRKDTIKDIEKPMLVQARIAATGFKDDKVECEEQWLDSLQIQVVRTDTNEIVEGPRPMTKEEVKKFNQQSMNFGTEVEVEVVDAGTGEVTGKRKKRVKLSPGSNESN
ncbi:MAG TPA: hypothetical protein PKA58_26295 [Polyangium sp.]|nr:hypothetical protein [Polyangium sp.]